MRDRQTKPGWRAIIHDIERVAFGAQLFEETGDDIRESGKAVFEFAGRRHCRQTEPRKVGRDHMIVVGKRWDEVAVHVRRAWKTVQQHHDMGAFLSSLAVEYFHAFNAGGSVMGDGPGHRPAPSVGVAAEAAAAMNAATSCGCDSIAA